MKEVVILQNNRVNPRSAFDDYGSDNSLENNANQKKEDLNEHNIGMFFAKSVSSGFVKLSPGKVLIKSFGFLDKIGYAFITIGFFVLLAILKNEETNVESSIPALIIGIILLGLGILIVSVVKTYSVIDYKSKTIYTETQLKGASIWKSSQTSINNIIEISLDNRPIESSAQNMGMGSQAYMVQGKGNMQRVVSKCDSAVAALLKSGKIFYITEFTNNALIREAYKSFSAEVAKAFGINYKTNFDDYKLVVKKRGPKYYFDIENYKKVTSDSILLSIARIMFGVAFILGAIILMFYLIYKFV